MACKKKTIVSIKKWLAFYISKTYANCQVFSLSLLIANYIKLFLWDLQQKIFFPQCWFSRIKLLFFSEHSFCPRSKINSHHSSFPLNRNPDVYSWVPEWRAQQHIFQLQTQCLFDSCSFPKGVYLVPLVS